MTPELLLVFPVLERPWRVSELAENAWRTTDVKHRVLFVVSPSDVATQQEVERLRAVDLLVAPFEPGPGDWARKINLAYSLSDEPWIFTGADDLRFYPHWASRGIGAGEFFDVGVVGTNDLHNPRVLSRQHATHSLVHRRYADEFGTVDGPGRVVAECYDHQYVDDELVRTARSRDQWYFEAGSVVEHLHPYFGGAEMDPTYEKALRATKADAELFRSRQGLWTTTGGSR